MFNNQYTNTYSPQSSIDRINTQISELEKLRNQIPQTTMQHPTNLTQNFQLTPSNNAAIRYVESIDDVQKSFVIVDTPFFSKDLSVLWIKNTKGEIKSYSITEIIQKDEKDLQIESLQAQIDELKGMIANEQSNGNVFANNESTEQDGNGGKLNKTKSRTK